MIAACLPNRAGSARPQAPGAGRQSLFSTWAQPPGPHRAVEGLVDCPRTAQESCWASDTIHSGPAGSQEWNAQSSLSRWTDYKAARHGLDLRCSSFSGYIPCPCQLQVFVFSLVHRRVAAVVDHEDVGSMPNSWNFSQPTRIISTLAESVAQARDAQRSRLHVEGACERGFPDRGRPLPGQGQ